MRRIFLLAIMATVTLVSGRAFAQSAIASEIAPAEALASGPIFYTNANYRGTGVSLAVGNYTQSAMVAAGIANNSISSIEVEPGIKVEAFANGDFTGASIIVAGDTPSLAARQFDNRISSMRITVFDAPATFFESCGGQGYSVSLPYGNFDRADLARWGIGDNQISEIVPQSNTEVEIFQHAAFGGGSRLARAAVCLPNVSGGFDNLTSSLRIRRSAVRFRDNFNSGSLAQWSTPIGVWSIQDGALVGEIGFDSAAYATPSRSYGGSLVLDADVNMANGNATLIFNSTGAAHKTEYRAYFWSSDSPDYPDRWQIIRFEDFAPYFPCAELPNNVDGNVLSPTPIPSVSHITIRRVGSTMDVYVDWVRIGRVTDPDPLPTAGKVGLSVIWEYSAAYDNFVVRR